MSSDLNYAIYVVVSIVMTIWVARTLSKNGEVFLVKCFGQDEVLAKSTNHLLVVGFYLINIGLIAIRLDGWQNSSHEPIVALVGSKIGFSALILGVMHFFNMSMIAKFGRTVRAWVNANEIQQAAHASNKIGTI